MSSAVPDSTSPASAGLLSSRMLGRVSLCTGYEFVVM